MMRAVGFTATMSLVFEYPAMVLLPVFSYWTIGPPDTGSFCFKPSSRIIGVSFFYTFLNFFMTILSSSLCIYFASLFFPRLYVPFIICCATFYLVGLLCILILNEQFCDLPVTNRVNFDINTQKQVEEEELKNCTLKTFKILEDSFWKLH